MRREYKILFTGPMGAGKTTAIAALSDVPPIVTDVANNDASVAKPTTTVGFDYGHFTLDSGDRIRLYGTPGQARFDFLWDILARDAIGLLILLDNSRPDPLQDLALYLDGFAKALDRLPCVVGVGRAQHPGSPPLDAHIELLAQRGQVLPVLEVDVRQRGDVLLLIDTLLLQLEASLLPATDPTP